MAKSNAEQMRPAAGKNPPDPSDSYERAHPEHEAGQGRLDNNLKATPTARPDKMPNTVVNAQDGSRQLNAQEASKLPPQPDHSMIEEEPLGWDQAPTDGNDTRAKRHPRTGGKGGTPDAGEAKESG
jgi:hypothetical protein